MNTTMPVAIDSPSSETEYGNGNTIQDAIMCPVTDNQIIDKTGLPYEESVLQNDDPFEFLKNQQSFIRMTDFLRENPSFSTVVLQQIAVSNPNLFKLISENMMSFLQLASEEVELSCSSSTITEICGDVDEEQVSEELSQKMSLKDQKAIDRLKCLHEPNFPVKFATDVYVAFKKNEQLATNFLLSDGDDKLLK